MTEQELRALVRGAIARQRGTPGVATAATPAPAPAPAVFHQHVSHGLFPLPAGMDTDGPCVIEPTVMCTHCGYCKSMGH